MDSSVSLIIAGIAAMLLLAFGIVFFVILFQRRIIKHQQELKKINEQKQQELLTASIESEEKERMRIAGELHDDVGATLSSVKLFLYSAAQTSDPAVIDRSRELLEESIRKIRNISHKLQPATLQHLGLKASLEAFADTINKSKALQMSCTIQPVAGLEEQAALAVYRIVQEAVSNIIRHASASVIFLSAYGGNARFHLSLSHNGTGLTDELYKKLIQKNGAIGLKNIENRIQSVNGSISFIHTASGNYEIKMTVPVKQ